MTRRDLADLRKKLLGERDRSEESLRRAIQHTLDDDDTTRDAGDLASASHNRDLMYVLQEYEGRRLKLINDVLAGMEQDGYGTCEECGQDIGKARLEAIPWATYCLSCQEEADARTSMAGVPSRSEGNREPEYGAA
jgi:DnaK suppressor protein